VMADALGAPVAVRARVAVAAAATVFHNFI
jgi:hypothetical protein